MHCMLSHSLPQSCTTIVNLHPVKRTVRSRPLQGEGVKGQLDDVVGVSSDLPRALHSVGVVVGVLRGCERALPF